MYYGAVMGRNSQKGWDVQYDILPDGKQVVHKVHKEHLSIIKPGEEEPELDPKELFQSDKEESGEKCSPKEMKTFSKKKRRLQFNNAPGNSAVKL